MHPVQKVNSNVEIITVNIKKKKCVMKTSKHSNHNVQNGLLAIGGQNKNTRWLHYSIRLLSRKDLSRERILIKINI
jgi:hypothetical protein